MGNLVKSELFKLGKNRSFWTLIYIIFAWAIVYPILIFFVSGTASVTVKELFLDTALWGNNYVIKLAPCILAGFFISSEYSIGTIKSITSSGNSRIRIYFSKLMVFSIGAIIISLILPIVMTGVGAILFDFNEMPDLAYFFRTIGLISIYAAAFSSIMALVSIIFTDSGKTIGFLLIFFLSFHGILFALSLKISFIEIILNYSVFKLLFDIPKFNLENSELLTLVLVPILTYVVFGLLGSFVFQKKEIK
ncbi:ABC transporter permease [Peribacillus sp. TH24]|uniref:ABC transporter permease n=1 Tax=Peribacillus sp. TH24 TaxID=2798483 RepID=UPI00191159D0|nr:ABC transporter permease [Peribacillus sp. TH24]MBK5446946.1 ABC transporter permease [Peribacillus sp. TH24]